jgi:hypothetical protein
MASADQNASSCSRRLHRPPEGAHEGAVTACGAGPALPISTAPGCLHYTNEPAGGCLYRSVVSRPSPPGKTRAPTLKDVVPRTALFRRLDRIRCPVTYIVGPPGSGKTVLAQHAPCLPPVTLLLNPAQHSGSPADTRCRRIWAIRRADRVSRPRGYLYAIRMPGPRRLARVAERCWCATDASE